MGAPLLEIHASRNIFMIVVHLSDGMLENVLSS